MNTIKKAQRVIGTGNHNNRGNLVLRLAVPHSNPQAVRSTAKAAPLPHDGFNIYFIQ